ncbi:hypothetical protein CPB84DRAFT_1384093 [Gymnopilus junonius]|uniref:Uncharacterized protein n=1 Tax=Gymnopilus junonius TaxID=109634 RepID=A0A9P5TK59_GYMJU|nr:hypothetical protein CPB84DRAFT_1384093 [Gymnopilus junonius]
MARNDFTASDDDHLIEYIAQQNPDSRGRMGNNLYKNLEENMAVVRESHMAILAREVQEEPSVVRLSCQKTSEETSEIGAGSEEGRGGGRGRGTS